MPILEETYLTKGGSIADLRLQDAKLKAEVSKAVIGVPNLDLSANEASQLTLQVLDPGFHLYFTGLFDLKTAMTFGEHKLEIAATGITGDSTPIIDLAARSAGIAKLKRAKGPQVVPNISPTEYVRVACKNVGLDFVGQDSPVQAQVVRSAGAEGSNEVGDDESTWDVMQRLATELGYICFEARNVVYFGKPSWLVQRSGRQHTVVYPKAKVAGQMTPFGVPTCRKSVDATKDQVTCEVVLDLADAVKIAPGDKLTLRGVPRFEGDYMVQSLSIDIDGISPVVVQAATPIDPEPQPPQPPDSYFDDDGNLNIADLFKLPAMTPVASTGGIGLTAPVSAGGRSYIWPVTGSISSRFGPRKSPGGIGSTNHQGIDIRAPGGTVIRATRAGTVVHAGWAGGYGNAIYIDHGGGVTSRYAHMKNYFLRSGMKVAQGQAIGTVNSTGNSTGNHLHFEIRINGRPVDPLPYLQTPVGRVPGSRGMPIS